MGEHPDCKNRKRIETPPPSLGRGGVPPPPAVRGSARRLAPPPPGRVALRRDRMDRRHLGGGNHPPTNQLTNHPPTN